LKQQKQTGAGHTEPDMLSAAQQLAAVAKRVRQLVDDQYRYWHENLMPTLERESIRFLTYPDVGAKTQKFSRTISKTRYSRC